MPNTDDPWRTTIRLSPAVRALLDDLGARLAPEGELPLTRTAVILLAVRRLAEAEGLPLPADLE